MICTQQANTFRCSNWWPGHWPLMFIVHACILVLLKYILDSHKRHTACILTSEENSAVNKSISFRDWRLKFSCNTWLFSMWCFWHTGEFIHAITTHSNVLSLYSHLLQRYHTNSNFYIWVLCCLMTPGLNKNFFLCLQITTAEIRPQAKYSINLVIVDDHFNLPQRFVWVCMGYYTHFITPKGGKLKKHTKKKTF